MKAFIEKIFKSKKLKKEQEEVSHKVEAIIKEVKKEKISQSDSKGSM